MFFSGNFQNHRAVVAAVHLCADGGVRHPGQQTPGHDEIVDAPPHVLLPGVEAVAPPGIGDLLRVQGPEGVGKARGQQGCKDIIKIDREMDLDWDLIGYVDPSITVNIIRDGKLVEKRTLKLPERIRGVLKCKNPRCITSVEQELPQEFVLTDREKRVYRCRYCETQAGK